MARKLFTELDLQRNQILNIVIENLASDPTSVYDKVEGAFYYNTTRKVLRIFRNGAWEDLLSLSTGMRIMAVDSLPQQGEERVLYLVRKAVGTNRYSSYVWVTDHYGQVSGYNVDWTEIENKPNILDCEYLSENEILNLKYIE